MLISVCIQDHGVGSCYPHISSHVQKEISIILRYTIFCVTLSVSDIDVEEFWSTRLVDFGGICLCTLNLCICLICL